MVVFGGKVVTGFRGMKLHKQAVDVRRRHFGEAKKEFAKLERPWYVLPDSPEKRARNLPFNRATVFEKPIVEEEDRKRMAEIRAAFASGKSGSGVKDDREEKASETFVGSELVQNIIENSPWFEPRVTEQPPAAKDVFSMTSLLQELSTKDKAPRSTVPAVETKAVRDPLMPWNHSVVVPVQGLAPYLDRTTPQGPTADPRIADRPTPNVNKTAHHSSTSGSGVPHLNKTPSATHKNPTSEVLADTSKTPPQQQLDNPFAGLEMSFGQEISCIVKTMGTTIQSCDRTWLKSPPAQFQRFMNTSSQSGMMAKMSRQFVYMNQLLANPQPGRNLADMPDVFFRDMDRLLPGLVGKVKELGGREGCEWCQENVVVPLEEVQEKVEVVKAERAEKAEEHLRKD